MICGSCDGFKRDRGSGPLETFRIPTNQVTTLRERFAERTRSTYREVPVLAGISFDVPRGEFLGIAGRNGSGKSTLLKILAGIYRPDSGTALGSGRIAPIIELGVGFNNELPAYDNVMMNAVMMGLQPAEARSATGRSSSSPS